MRVLLTVLLVGAAACSDTPTAPPDRPSFELVNPGERMSTVNSHVYGSFSVAAGGGVITSGPANFPGHPPAGPGTCVNGKWLNPQGKGTSGTLAKPHPHCFSPAAAIEVVLEPITACYTGAQDAVSTGGGEVPADPAAPAEPGKVPAGKGCQAVKATKGATTTYLTLRKEASDVDGTLLWSEAYVQAVDYTAAETPDSTVGAGMITGYAIDASTLGTTNKRVGTLRINLSQYNSETTAYIHLNDAPGCKVDESIESPCLDNVIMAIYNPLPAAQGGIGPADKAVEGFLWVTPADSPYNYTE